MGRCWRCAKDSGKAREPTKTVNLVFYRAELNYDIESYAYVEGDVMIVAREEHERHQCIDVMQDGNENLVTRILTLASDEVVEALYPYSKDPVVEGEEFTDELEAPERYELKLTVPETMSRTSVQYLRSLIHDYLVSRVLWEWMKLTNIANPHSKANWEQMVETLKTNMKSAVRWRTKPLRLGQHPF